MDDNHSERFPITVKRGIVTRRFRSKTEYRSFLIGIGSARDAGNSIYVSQNSSHKYIIQSNYGMLYRPKNVHEMIGFLLGISEANPLTRLSLGKSPQFRSGYRAPSAYVEDALMNEFPNMVVGGE
jgi:hypothetical protein